MLWPQAPFQNMQLHYSADTGNGKLFLSDFNKKDTLVVGDETFTTKNFEDAPNWVKFDA